MKCVVSTIVLCFVCRPFDDALSFTKYTGYQVSGEGGGTVLNIENFL